MADEPEASPAGAEKFLAAAQAATSKLDAAASANTGEEPAGALDQSSIEDLLNQAQSALSSLDEPAATLPAGVSPFEFKNLAGAAPANETASLDLLRDVQLDLKIELGRTHMHLEDVLRLKQGAVVTLDKLAGDPVDIYANGRLIARGEVLVLNDNFCVRVAELIAEDTAAA